MENVEEKQGERESVWEAVWVRFQTSLCEVEVGRRDPGFFIIEGSGMQSRCHSSLVEDVSGGGRGRVTQRDGSRGKSAEACRTRS